MKKRRFFALFLVLGLLVSLLSVPASAFEEIDVDARAALLVEKETGEILYEKNAHEKNYPASITKLTVALLVFEAIDAGQLSLDQPITAHESAFEGLSIYGSTAGIKVGEVLTVEQLLQCMLIVSANEACNILAEAVCGEGNISQFVQRMNERAAALGCENTHYVNTSGLHDPDHYTTAWDIYLITRALMPYEKFMEICNSKSAEIAETDHNQRHVLHSTNRLISNWREPRRAGHQDRLDRGGRSLPRFLRRARRPSACERGARRGKDHPCRRQEHPHQELFRDHPPL